MSVGGRPAGDGIAGSSRSTVLRPRRKTLRQLRSGHRPQDALLRADATQARAHFWILEVQLLPEAQCSFDRFGAEPQARPGNDRAPELSRKRECDMPLRIHIVAVRPRGCEFDNSGKLWETAALSEFVAIMAKTKPMMRPALPAGDTGERGQKTAQPLFSENPLLVCERPVEVDAIAHRVRRVQHHTPERDFPKVGEGVRRLAAGRH